MPLSQPAFPDNQYLDTILSRVALSSAASPCPICQEPYSSSSPPVLIPECGHIFCRPCITAWFESGLENANTCPLDRGVLSSSQRGADASDQDGASALARSVHLGPARDIVERPIVELFMGGEIIAVDGLLMRQGCKCVIKDLWFLTARLLQSTEGFCGGEVDALGLDVKLLRSCVQDALPRGVRCGEEGWNALYGCARQMLVWHSEDGRGEWEGGEEVLVEELRGFVMSLHGTFSG